jgi:hypothetical protein
LFLNRRAGEAAGAPIASANDPQLRNGAVLAAHAEASKRPTAWKRKR